ncbi:LanC-like protein 3 [Hypsizygus marmoreus]|uniref:LanC-like protein 3 n=1 Tax=Hypsizygus marmoreus TaxID=39966 RepID=A0A369K8A6_HYPMA|nr:LanC-like protein 3 [Hypsizygus marmoreus]
MLNVRWCHGVTRILILLSAFLRQSRLVACEAAKALHRHSRLVYQDGLLCESVGLCHGIVGSVYALLSASNAFEILEDFTEYRNERYRLNALHLATDHEGLTINDRPWSLYEELAGIYCASIDVLYRMSDEERRVGMPGFDDF